MRKFFSVALLTVGTAVLTGVFLPMAISQLSANFDQPGVIIDPTDVQSQVDDTQVAAWFEGQPPLPKTKVVSKISYYTLSIPAVNLSNVTVEINGTDLLKNAIQYPGSALPGSAGNTVIFGHDTLPQLSKPGEPLSIFNPLLKAKVGDEVSISYDGVTYRYLVRQIFEVKPTQIEVLAQDYNRYDLTLITCTPPGTFFRRFIVRAELVN